MSDRQYKYDTMKFFLLFLVILGHEIELFLDGRLELLYITIYTFHMPAFMFITGKFAKFDRKHILKHLCLPYVVFQIIYLCFSALVISGTEIVIQFTTPYWILWYLLAVIFCYLIIPILPSKESKWSLALILGSFVLAILVGYESGIGYYLTLSRFFVYLPFFLCGYYQDLIVSMVNKRIKIKPYLLIALSLIVLLLCESLVIENNVSIGLIYGSCAYDVCEGSALLRILVQVTSIAWIVLLCNIIPDKSIPVISTLSKNTMSVFLLHGFAIGIMRKAGFFHFAPGINLLLALLIAVVLFIALGNSYIGKLFKYLF